MRKILNRTLAILAAGLMLGACEKNTIAELADPAVEGAKMKFFFHADGAPRSNFYIGSQKITGVAPNADGVILGNAYGSVYPSNAYAVMPTGSFTLSVIDTMKTGGTADLLASTQVNLENKKNYSAYLVGATPNYEAFIIEDKLPQPDNVSVWWRFVHTMAEMPFKVDFYAVRAAIPETPTTPAEPVEVVELGKNIGFKEYTDYKRLKPGSYTFKVFQTGTTYNPETSTPYLKSTVSLASLGRVYTTQIRGTYAASPKTSNIDYWRDR